MMKQEKLEQTKWSAWVIIARFLSAIALLALGLSWPRLLSGKTAWIERVYSEGIYPWIRRLISAVTRVVPFSIAEFLLYGIVLAIALLLLIRLIQLLFARNGFARLMRSLASILLAGGIVLNLFYVTWGFNYFREPLAQRMELTITSRSVDELEAFVRKTASQARELRATLHENADGVFEPEESRGTLFLSLRDAYTMLHDEIPVIPGNPTRAKQIFWSQGLSWQGISGIYIGLTAEPNVNVDQPPLLVYQAAAHEMAHQTGIASENEAELVGYLACIRSNDPNIRYSGLAYALIVAGNALYAADSARYLALTDTYGDAIWRDLSAYSVYWKAFSGEIRESADKRNDAYLKHNSQPSGIKSYGEAVDLLLAYEAKYGASAAAVGVD
ncbi:MAG TPA: DUF3810 domain-containing protein [Clostridia bacterium]|nr:DUF3810 domain-containing protein [Clostridia bacterium]